MDSISSPSSQMGGKNSDFSSQKIGQKIGDFSKKNRPNRRVLRAHRPHGLDSRSAFVVGTAFSALRSHVSKNQIEKVQNTEKGVA